MISSAFPSTPTGALEMLLNIMPINEFIMSKAVKGSYRISRVKFWPAKTIDSIRKTKSHVDVCNEAKALQCKLIAKPDFSKVFNDIRLVIRISNHTKKIYF